MIETVRISEKAKSQLIQVKRKTGIEHWNVLCRWALCLSLAEKSTPPFEDIYCDSNVEMNWKTFAGKHSEFYEAILKQRMASDAVPVESSQAWFIIHLHRGISYLTKRTNSLESLIAL